MNDTALTTRRLIVLGSTGSIGVNTLKVVEHLNAQRDGSGPMFQVVGLAAGRNVEVLADQARRFNVPAVALADETAADALGRALPNVKVHRGPDAALRLVEQSDASDVIAAVVGSAGLPATLAAAKRGMRIGLANKETLVAAGPLVVPIVRRHGAVLIPVDSEHSAIFQCLQCQARVAAHGAGPLKRAAPTPNTAPTDRTGAPTPNPLPIKRIVLTASGGPFRTADKAAIDNATVEQALKHPTWKMGPKITIDSATMMNKALEIIEAHWLFDLPPDRIEVIIHPQSVAHSFVEFADNSVLAQLGPPDMRTPIQYALTYPQRSAGCSQALDWSKLRTLEFDQPDHERFPALKLAYKVIEAGGTAGAVFNAANEAAVAAFLERRIPFGRIVELVAEALAAVEPRPLTSLDDVLLADQQARALVDQRLQAAVN